MPVADSQSLSWNFFVIFTLSHWLWFFSYRTVWVFKSLQLTPIKDLDDWSHSLFTFILLLSVFGTVTVSIPRSLTSGCPNAHFHDHRTVNAVYVSTYWYRNSRPRQGRPCQTSEEPNSFRQLHTIRNGRVSMTPWNLWTPSFMWIDYIFFFGHSNNSDLYLDRVLWLSLSVVTCVLCCETSKPPDMGEGYYLDRLSNELNILLTQWIYTCRKRKCSYDFHKWYGRVTIQGYDQTDRKLQWLPQFQRMHYSWQSHLEACRFFFVMH